MGNSFDKFSLSICICSVHEPIRFLNSSPECIPQNIFHGLYFTMWIGAKRFTGSARYPLSEISPG